MRDFKIRIFILIAILLLGLVVPSFGAASSRVIWDRYHKDNRHTGQNENSTDLSNPANLNLIWVFPKKGGETIVDDFSGDSGFTFGGPWGGATDTEAYNSHFMTTPALARKNTVSTTTYATWPFPDDAPKGNYQVWIWIPSTPKGGSFKQSTQAEYTVHDDSGDTVVKFDQTEGGTWRLLTTRFFSFKGNDTYSVTLKPITDDEAIDISNDKIRVAADAIKFVGGTEQEIYSSPVSAEVPYNFKSTTGSLTWSGTAPAVYVGTVDPPYSNTDDAPDMGTVYCIDSVTPTDKDVDDDSLWLGSGTDQDTFKELRKNVGSTKWQYPRKGIDRQNPTTATDPIGPNDIEGPIAGGVYASPLLFQPKAATVGSTEMMCVVAGMDGQMYSFDALTGRLLWQGPGVTVSEGVDLTGTGTKMGWLMAKDRDDAFGGRFHYAPVNSSALDITWDFASQLAAVNPGSTNLTTGYSYAVYAWMPGMFGSDKERAKDATYTITYIKADAKGAQTTATATVVVDQSEPSNQGRWVRLGSSFFNVQSVALSAKSKDTAGATQKYIVADAVRIMPDTLGPFGYSSPVIGSPTDDPQVYGVTSNGRVVAINVVPGANKVGTVRWIYPAVRTSLVVSGSDTADKEELGETSASPSYYYDATEGRFLYVACMGGTIHAIKGVDTGNPVEAWSYNDPDDTGGFSSSPVVDAGTPGNGYSPQILIGSIGGAFYGIDALKGPDVTNPARPKPLFRYPDLPAGSGSATGPMDLPSMPLGSFRFSTAAVADDKSGPTRRAWIGSSDGRIYSFCVKPGDTYYGQRIYVEYDDEGKYVADHGGKNYTEPSLHSPIQGSVAIDGKVPSGKPPIMYVGDMSGNLQWYNSDDGSVYAPGGGAKYKSWQTQGELFSSPSISEFTIQGRTHSTSYVYVGCADGRIYAFSSGGSGGAWGGKWAMEGWWPFEGEPNSNDAKEESYKADTDIQFDIFDSNLFEKSLAFNPEEMYGSEYLKPDSTYPNGGWPVDGAEIVSQEMKMPTTSLKGKTDTEIDDALRSFAKEQRNYVYQENARTSGSDRTIYFEWGQTLNLILWNLPEMAGLYPGGKTQGEKSKRSNIKFTLTNASAGQSAGSQIRLSGVVKLLKEYTVLDSSSTGTVTNSTTSTTYNTAKALQYANSHPVKRCYALAQIEISGTSSRPPSPGPGWNLIAEIKTQSNSKAPVIMYSIPLAKLKAGGPGGAPDVVQQQDKTGNPIGELIEQPLGINNPLGIRVNNSTYSMGLAWSTNGTTNSSDAQAHFNGNSIINGSGNSTSFGRMGIDLNLGMVAHGSVSPEMALGIQDRSAVGCNISSGTPLKTDNLQRFRVNAGDLRWMGGDGAISTSRGFITYGKKFPWELGPGSVDYPNIYKRYQSYRKATDDKDPSRDATDLPPVLPVMDASAPHGYSPDYSKARIRTESVFVSVNVPKYQPANMSGYNKRMQAFIDSDGDREWDSGDTVLGRPSTYQEAYREFSVKMQIPPDPKIQVEEQLIDIGRAPHGLGEQCAFNAYNLDPMIKPWFKEITIKNAGNVNLYNLRIGKNLINGSGGIIDLPLYSDQASPTAPLPGGEITSSLDSLSAPYNVFNTEPFITHDTGGTSLGYTLTKPRVGDPDPTVLTVPDSRKWAMNYDNVKNTAAGIMQHAGWPSDRPMPVRVSVKVPLGQPVGNYMASFVPVYADLYPGTAGGDGKFEPNQGEPFADPSFQLKIAVREAQMTGGFTPTTLPMIDSMPEVKFGDSTPAGFVDANTGNAYLYWSSNRVYASGLEPNWNDPTDPHHKDFMNAPWFINCASLAWGGNNSGFTPDSSSGTWWTLPSQPYPISSGWSQWPTTLLNNNGSPSVIPWMGSSLKSVRHESPVLAENYQTAANAAENRTWLAWTGTANIQNNTGLTQEHRLFYVDATHGALMNSPGGKGHDVYTIDQDPQMDKRYPSMAIYDNYMWMFWQGALKDKWGIFYSINDDSPKHDPSNWKTSAQLRTPDCLSSVASPNALHRRLWANSGADAKDLLDVVFTGTGKLTQNSDIMLSRYMAAVSGGTSPANRAQPLPRVYAERLQKDATYNVYTSRHIAWLRLNQAGYNNVMSFVRSQGPAESGMLTDHVGMQEHINFENWLVGTTPRQTLASKYTVLFNTPYIWVDLPAGYDSNYPNGAIISATDGSVMTRDNNGNLSITVNPQPISPLIDNTTGVYNYKYPQPEAAALLGEMLVDYSAGVVRFTKAFKEMKDSSGKVVTPEVYADYTPQTWKLTTDTGADDSARAFIERTQMTPGANPGMCKWTDSQGKPLPSSIDRLWVLWRKAGTGINSSTIFYSTYRIGVDLTKLLDASGNPARPIQWDTTNNTFDNVQVAGNVFGPWEVNRTGTRIYFSQIDERYRSLITSGSIASGPGPLTITYKNIKGNTQKVVVDDIYWLTELPEQSLFGFTSDGNVNEGSVYAFADPAPKYRKSDGTFDDLDSSKIWVFWTSTRGGSSDLFWETLSPNFSVK